MEEARYGAVFPRTFVLVRMLRAERTHFRLSWVQRLARNAHALTAGQVTIKLFGVPPAFAAYLGLPDV